jgi:O-antigen ligase
MSSASNQPVARVARTSVPAVGPVRGRPSAAQPNGAVASVAPDSTRPQTALYGLRVRALWDYFKAQPTSFKLVCLYLFMEYVRPQQIWSAIAGPPYAKFIIVFAVVAFFAEGRRFRVGLPEVLLGIFSLIVLASSFLAISPDASFAELSLYFSWLLIYLLISNSADSEERFLLFALTFILYSFKMAQHGTRSWASEGFAFRSWGTNGAPGWFSNSGEFGIQMCVFLPIVVCFTRSLSPHWSRWKRYAFWLMPATAVMSIVGSSSRGALVGLAAVALWMLAKSRYKVRGLLATVVLAAGVYFLLPQQQIQRLQDMGDDGTSISRTTLWQHGRQMMSDYPVLGIGYKNWLPYHETHYGLRLLPHNIFVEAGSELGYSGLAAFIALILVTLVINHRTRRLSKRLPGGGRFMFDMAHGLDAALIGYLASGFFVTVLYYPFFWINLAMTVALHNAATRAAGESVPAQPALPRGRHINRAPVTRTPAFVRRVPRLG